MRVLIVIPTYNEIENLPFLLKEILSQTPTSVEVLVVDDASPDGTGSFADQFAKQNLRFHVLHRTKKMGLGTAYVQAFQWGLQNGFEAFIEMDADFSHSPHYLIPMLEKLQIHDVVIGSRYIPGGGTLHWGLGRKILSRLGSCYARWVLHAPIHDFTGGFNGWNRKVLESIQLDTILSNGYLFQIEIKYRAYLKGFLMHEFPIIFEDRKIGRSKMNRRIVLEAVLCIWSLRDKSK